MKRWVTNHFEGTHIAEFRTEADMRRGIVFKRHLLPHSFRGTNSALFNGSLFYHRGGTARLARYDFSKKHYDEIIIHPKIAYNSDNVIYLKKKDTDKHRVKFKFCNKYLY